MDAEGYVISTAELANFFLAMTVSPLVILSGISGTGKSLLPRKFAMRTSSHFKPIPVQPQWSDNSDLFGYVPTLSPTSYIKGALVESLVKAKQNPKQLVIALLDEMNLAPVEHYFSDFLSVAETRGRDAANRITTDELPVELPQIVLGQPDAFAALRGIQIPSNLRVVGTANMDETTHSFSPKVLDRAFTIEFDDPDLTSFASGSAVGAETFDALAEIVINETNAISVLEAKVKSQDLFEHIAQLLSEIQDILAPAGIKFGYRTRDAILLYLHFWRELGLADIMAGYAAFDFCLLQKILPKISGSGEGLAVALSKLSEWFKARSDTKYAEPGIDSEFAGPLERSHQKVSRMIELLSLDGSTRYWGA
jgi:5-methylcytosine-specific restriction endonuclease McrBC GTP-binding regulatory subunit McrB